MPHTCHIIIVGITNFLLLHNIRLTKFQYQRKNGKYKSLNALSSLPMSFHLEAACHMNATLLLIPVHLDSHPHPPQCACVVFGRGEGRS